MRPFRLLCDESGTAATRPAAPVIRKVLAIAIANMSANADIGGARLQPLRGGRSAAGVYKATLLSNSGLEARTPLVVVKVTSAADCAVEHHNHQAFASLLPSAYRPTLLGVATRGRLGALCLSYFGDRSQPARTLTDDLQAGDIAPLDLFCGSTVLALREHWYEATTTRRLHGLGQRYLEHYFGTLEAAIHAEAILEQYGAAYLAIERTGSGYRHGSAKFPNLVSLLFGRADRSAFTSCIVHGDLNSDNVMTLPHLGVAALIDFQKTGRGHLFEDLVAIETSIRINYRPEIIPREMLDRERHIVAGHPAARHDAYASAIATVQRAARSLGDLEEWPTYHFAVAAIGLRLMLATDLSIAAKARIAASTFWSALMVERHV